MTDRVCVRFAPSPTGSPHVGNIRTAIFDWLFARGNDGFFIIRVEDTDRARLVEGSIDELLESLRWLGIDWDEGPDVGGPNGPYYQSERLALYRKASDDLIEKGVAYKCYCTPERLEKVRKQRSGYDRHCRLIDDAEHKRLESSSIAHVVRYAMPFEGETKLDDLIRGVVTFDNGLIDDFVMLKSDGFPTYHLANVIDDHYMSISHVFRAEEWLSSTPRHLKIYESLGWQPPLFAHFPQILAPDRSKLSKRHGATSVNEYREMGYLPETLVNFLALLGWSVDDKTEIMSTKQMFDSFSLERVSKSGAIFDGQKLEWMNGYYIRNTPADILAGKLLDYWRDFPTELLPSTLDKDRLIKIVPLIQERLKTLRDAASLISFFFKEDIEYKTDELIQKNMDIDSTKYSLQMSLKKLRESDSFQNSTIENDLRDLADDLGIKVGQMLGSLRVAITGLKVAPPLFETLEILGSDRVTELIEIAIKRLEMETLNAVKGK